MATLNTGAKAGDGVTAFAFTKGSAWGTAVAVGASDGALVTSESVQGGFEPLEDAAAGAPWGNEQARGGQAHRGTISGDLYYGGNLGKLLAYFFGNDASQTQSPPSTGTSYLHAVTLENTLDDFLTLCVGKRAGQKWWEYASAKATRLVIRGEGNGRVTFELDWIANALDRDSSTNTTTQTDAVTVPSREAAVRFKDGLFRINAQGGGALASTTDDIHIRNFELEINRAMSEDHLADGTTYAAEPQSADVGSVFFRFSPRSYDSETWKDAYEATGGPTEYKFDCKFTGTGLDTAGAGTGADPYYEFQSPRCVVSLDPQANISSRGRIEHNVTLKCLVAASAPTGMSGVTQPVGVNIMDLISADYLA